MKKSLKARELTDYSTYRMSKGELILYIAQGMGYVCLFAYFFYKSVIAALFMCPFVYFYIKNKKIQLGEKRKKELEIQFKEALIAVESSLEAGHSLENAFIDAYDEMVSFYGREGLICRELLVIKRGLGNNYSLPVLLNDFSARSAMDDIGDFGGLITIGKQTGGNITGILKAFIEVTEEKTEVIQEIDTMISARKFEQKIMNAVPFFIIFYVDLTSKGFFDMLYHNVFGIMLMTLTLGIYLAAMYLSGKIMMIEV